MGTRVESQKLTFVSVVFEAELPLLRIQARSAAIYLPAELVEAIIVIDNTARGISAKYRQDLRSDYGPLASFVQILRPSDICQVASTTGWRSQQILKLMIAERITSKRYVTLDAKNHFVNPVELGFFEAADGRARVSVYGYETHPLRPNLERVLTYVGLDPNEYVGRFTATVTPFVLDTATVQAMIADVQARSGRDFSKEFVVQDLTEFFLYAGWILAQGESLDEAFDCDRPSCPTVWPRSADIDGVRAAIAQADEGDAPVFSVHRRALAQLDPASTAVLASFWTQRGLFESEDAATEFVLDFQRSYQKAARRQRRRDLPGKVASVPRKIRGKLRS